MNLNNKFGVSLTVLVITIIVMLILFGITFSTATDLLKNSQRNKMKTMLYMVQSRAEILLNDYLFDYDNDNTTVRSTNLNAVDDATIGTKLGGTYEKNLSSIKAVGFGSNLSAIPAKDKVIYCSWNEQTLLSQGIDTKNLADRDTIIIEYDLETSSVNVASTKGYSDNGVGIHKLNEF